MAAPGFALPPADTALIGVSPGELRAATLRGGRPWELFVARDTRPSLVGNVYLARVQRVEPGLAAAFLDIGEAEAAFLPVGAARPSEGAAVIVQILRDAFDGKGPTATTRIALPGRYLVFTPQRPGVAAAKRLGGGPGLQRAQGALLRLLSPEEGAILRTAAAGIEPEVLAAELDRLRRAWAGIEAAAHAATAPARLHRDLPPLLRFLRDRANVPRILIDERGACAEAERFAAAQAPDLAGAIHRHDGPEPLLDAYGVEAEIERALGGTAPLPSGGALHVESTRALTAIDLDTGRFTGRGRAAETMLEAGLEAAVEAARIIRFRNLAGLIVIDFANPAERAHRRQIEARLRAAFAEDIAETRILPMSELGLIEMSRQRLGPALADVLGDRCGQCGGLGRVASAETVALAALRAVLRAAVVPGGRPCIKAAPPVLSVLEGPLAPARQAVETRIGQPLVLRSDPTAGPDQVQVEMER